MVSGVSTDSTNTQHPYTELYVDATPKLGVKHFYKYIYKNIIVPFEEDRNHPRGKMVLEFDVDKNGWICNVKVIQKLGLGLDEEAVRILRNYEGWYPAQKRGIKYNATFTIPISIYSR